MFDVQRGTTRVDFNRHSTSEEAVMVVVLTVRVYPQKGLNQLTFLLDNAKIHGKRMEVSVHELLAEIAQHVELPTLSLRFWHTPSYSPNLILLNTSFTKYGEMVYITCPVH